MAGAGNTSQPDHRMMAMVRRVAAGGMLAGAVGGLVMIVLMILVMGGSGSGYWSPLNLGIPAFAATITPPLSMLSNMMAAMGVHLPSATMAQLGPAIAAGHIPHSMLPQLSAMLMKMHLPAAQVSAMGALMSGHASNSDVTSLLASLPPGIRGSVMAAMPVSAGHIVLGAATHFVLAVMLGMIFAMMIIGVGIGRLSFPMLQTRTGIITVSILGGALVYVVNRWLILPAIDPMMKLVPETAFFIAHLLFGAVVGIGVAIVAAREGVLNQRSAARLATA